MFPRIFRSIALLLVVVAQSLADEPAKPDVKETYTLRYRFKSGEKAYWEVSHRADITSTAAGTTQKVESASDSLKVWEITDVNAKGQITFVHAVDWVRMRHRSVGREEVVFEFPLPPGQENIPLGYESAAKDVGVPLTKVVMNPRGQIVRRQDLRKTKKKSTSGYEGPLTIPLPAEAVEVGEKWSDDHIVSVPRKDGTFKRVKLQQRFTLQRVKNNIASIYVESVVLTPVRDPNIKVHLVQSKTRGTVRFDIEAGRVTGQDLSLDERIIGAPLGDASSTHYVMQFTESYHSKPPKTARRASARPK